jgi:hypothetical protein
VCSSDLVIVDSLLAARNPPLITQARRAIQRWVADYTPNTLDASKLK